MENERIEVSITFTVNPEYVPGWGYDPQDFATAAKDSIKRMLAPYNVIITEAKITKTGDNE